MKISAKKILIVGSASILALSLVLGIWLFGGKSRIEVYSSSDSGPLKADFDRNPRENLNEWERQILDRESSGRNLNATASGNINGSNYTQQLARSVLEEYFRAKQLNTSDQELDISRLVESVLNKNPVESLREEMEAKYTEYKISDLKIIPMDDAETLKAYGNKLGEVIIKNSYDPDKTGGNEAEIFFRITQQFFPDKREFGKLDPIIESYESIAQSLLQLETPAEIVSDHLRLLEVIDRYSVIVKEFKYFFENPVKGLIALDAHVKNGLVLKEIFSAINDYLESRGIVFRENETGFLIERTANMSSEVIN